LLIVDEWSTPRAVEWYLRAVLALKDDFAWCSQLHCSARKKGSWRKPTASFAGAAEPAKKLSLLS
jgi:hypothetical protein